MHGRGRSGYRRRAMADSVAPGMPIATGHIPVWIKVVYTLYLCVLVPVYWTHYGPQNFLWFSDIALLTIAAALWLESPLLASTMAAAPAAAAALFGAADDLLPRGGLPADALDPVEALRATAGINPSLTAGSTKIALSGHWVLQRVWRRYRLRPRRGRRR
jgi:hypothetical protein